MTTSILRRTGALAAVAVALTFSLAACGSDDDKGSDTKSSDDSSMSTDNAGDGTFGAGCAAIPKDGAGSFNGMATAPVATAASANPVLSTLVTAVDKAGLVDTLNGGEAWTVFAPTNDAFAKIPAKDLAAVLADKATLTKILTHHVIEGQLAPDALAGTHKTVAGDDVTVEGSGEDFSIENAGGAAKVVCGNVKTSNATVYIIDTVLMPAA